MTLLIIFLVLCFKFDCRASDINLISNESFWEYIQIPEEELKTINKTFVTRDFVGYFDATGYCPCSSCCGSNTGLTASGAIATANKTIAMSKSYNFGEEFVINGHKYTVEDRGGAIKGNRIDIFFNSHGEALNFGRRKVRLYKEVEVVYSMKQVNLNEYIAFTGDRLMKDRLAKSYYDKATDITEWKNNAGKVLATRYKDNGKSVHFVDEELFNEWNNRR